MSSTTAMKKNRTTYINEFIDALVKLDDFQYTAEEMHGFLEKAAKSGSGFRKLSKSGEKDASGPKKLTGWTLFGKHHKGLVFNKEAGETRAGKLKTLWEQEGEEGRKGWNTKAQEHNLSNGFAAKETPVKKKTYADLLDEWKISLAQYYENGQVGDMPIMPEKPTKIPKTEEFHTPLKQPTTDPNEIAYHKAITTDANEID